MIETLNTPPRIAVCHECHGYGTAFIRRSRKDRQVVCPLCEGSGMVSITMNTVKVTVPYRRQY